MNPLLFLFLVVLGIALVCWLACFLADDRITVEPEPKPNDECDVLTCTHEGWVRVTWRCDGASGAVCHGHYDEGIARGWWVA